MRQACYNEPRKRTAGWLKIKKIAKIIVINEMVRRIANSQPQGNAISERRARARNIRAKVQRRLPTRLQNHHFRRENKIVQALAVKALHRDSFIHAR